MNKDVVASGDISKLIASQVAIYGAFQFLRRGVTFLVIPLYTHFLTPAEFGVLDLVLVFVWMVGVVAGGRFEAAFLRFYTAAESNQERSDTFARAMTLVVLGATLAAGLGLASADVIQELLLKGEAHGASAVRLGMVALWCELLASIPLALLRAKGEALVVGSIATVQNIVSALGGLACVAVFAYGILGPIGALAFSQLLCLALCVWRIRRYADLRFLLVGSMALAKYSAPLVPAAFLMMVLNYADRLLLAQLGSMSYVGEYAMAYKLGMLVNLLVVAPFGEMWGPMQFTLYQRGAKETYRTTALWYVGAFSLVAAGIACGSFEFFLLLVDERYHSAVVLVPTLAVAVAVWAIVPVLDLGCHVTGKTWRRLVAVAIAASANLVLNVTWIPLYGVWGATLATLASYVVLACATYFVNRRLTDFRVCLPRAALIYAGLALCAFSASLSSVLPYSQYLALRVIAFSCFSIVVVVMCFGKGRSIRDVRNWRSIVRAEFAKLRAARAD